MEKAKSLTEKVRDKLRARYREDLLLEEFSTPNESDYYNHADAIGISCHPRSRGTNIEYFEVKALRADWMKELEHPSKSEGLSRYCDKLWLVTTDERIALKEEIPVKWGWMYLKGQRLKVGKDAPKLEPVFDRGFVIRVAQYSRREFNKEIAAKEYEMCQKIKKELEEAHTGDYWKDEANKYKRLYESGEAGRKAFEDAVGYSPWHDIKDLKEVAALAKALLSIRKSQKALDGGISSLGWDLRGIKDNLAIIEDAVKRLHAED